MFKKELIAIGCGVKIKPEQNFFTPIKIGLFIVITTFFLFTLHGLLTMEWWGEWEYFQEPTRSWIF